MGYGIATTPARNHTITIITGTLRRVSLEVLEISGYLKKEFLIRQFYGEVEWFYGRVIEWEVFEVEKNAE